MFYKISIMHLSRMTLSRMMLIRGTHRRLILILIMIRKVSAQECIMIQSTITYDKVMLSRMTFINMIVSRITHSKNDPFIINDSEEKVTHQIDIQHNGLSRMSLIIIALRKND
jgi:hypothetical protein